MDQRPIGIFDSGIGGLTVASAINNLLPEEQLIYFGDTIHLPYGEKNPKTIRKYAEGITRFLLSRDCKAIVIACNSASAVAYANVKRIAGKSIPVINVIDPTAQYTAGHYSKGKIGVIATKATVNSRIYARRIEKLNPDLKVTMLATPLLVSMIEEGFFSNTISRAIIQSYLDKPNLSDIACLILGCTHFPLIKKEVEDVLHKKAEVLDSSIMVAKALETVLQRENKLSEKRRKEHHFYVSEKTDSFSGSTSLFFGETLRLETKNIWLT